MSPVIEIIFLTIFFTILFLLFHVRNMHEIMMTLLWHGIALAIALIVSQVIFYFIIKNWRFGWMER